MNVATFYNKGNDFNWVLSLSVSDTALNDEFHELVSHEW